MTGYLLWLSTFVAIKVGCKTEVGCPDNLKTFCLHKYMDGTRKLKIIHVTKARFFFYKNTLSA